MRSLAVVLLLLMGARTGAMAQKYLDRLRNSSVSGATVTVNQSKEIDALVNGTVVVSGDSKQTSVATSTAKKPPLSSSVVGKSTLNSTARDTSEVESVIDSEGDTASQKKVMRDGRKITGYRVQVFSGGNSREDKNKAYETGSAMKAYFPEQPVYVHFYSPKWKCLMGNFRTYEEAGELLRQVKEFGYGQATIIKGKITVSN